jgi:HAD superfamily hydrolase (TIGR01509 family)
MTEKPNEQPDNTDTPAPEPLTPEEKDALLSRVRAEGRAMTLDEINTIFEPSIDTPAVTEPEDEVITEMAPASLAPEQIALLEQDFFSNVESDDSFPSQRLVTGVIFDFDYTLAVPTRPIDAIMEEGAKNAEAYMRSTGMEFAEDFYTNIIEARRFALKKSEDEQEEHIADDAMSFLLQFFGYPASKMDPEVLKRAVDVFYAPEMTAWQLRPGVRKMLERLHSSGIKLALLANYPCDRVFQRVVDYLEIRQYFDVCLCSASVEYRKPDESFFNVVLDRWDALPYEIVVVGDSLTHDVQGGLNLGALTVQLDRETSAQDAHDNKRAARKIAADEVIDDLSDLPTLIEKWA